MPTKKTIKVRQLRTWEWEWWVEFRSWPDGANEGTMSSPTVTPDVLSVYGHAFTRWGAVRQARSTRQKSVWEVVS